MLVVIGHRGPMNAKRMYVNVSREEAERRYIAVFGMLPVGEDAMAEELDGDEWEVADIWKPMVE